MKKNLKIFFISISAVSLVIYLLISSPLREHIKKFIGKERISKAKYVTDLILDDDIQYGDTIISLYEDSINNLYRDTNYFLKNPRINATKKHDGNIEFLVFDLPNIFPGKHSDATNTGYIDFHNDKIYMVSGTGVVFKLIETPTGITPYLVRSNFNTFSNYPAFNTESRYGVKDILISNDRMFVSFTEKIGSGFNTSIVSSPIKDSLEFQLVLRSENFIDPDQIDAFNAHQSGGRMIAYTSDSILVTIGEYRDRTRAQDSSTINGKILSVNYKLGAYRLVSKGHRNPQGLDYCSEHDILISSDHGPSGGDEINFHHNTSISKNFGWPISSYGLHYALLDKNGKLTPDERRLLIDAPLYKSHADHGFEEPVKYFEQNPALSELQIIEHDSHSIKFLVSTLGWDRSTAPYKRSLLLFDFNRESREIKMVNHIKINQRIRDIIINKNNDCLYFLGETTGVIGKIKTEDLLYSNE